VLAFLLSLSALESSLTVSAVCGMVAWQLPPNVDCELVIGFDVHFSFIESNETVVVCKKRDEFFHTLQDSDIPMVGHVFTALVKVRHKRQ